MKEVEVRGSLQEEEVEDEDEKERERKKVKQRNYRKLRRMEIIYKKRKWGMKSRSRD